MFEMEILFLLGICPEVELLNILVVLLSNFLENSVLFYMVAIFIYMPINSVKDSLFSTSSPPLISYPFDIAILTSVRLSYYCFDLHISDYVMWSIFQWTSWPFVCFLFKKVHFFGPFLIRLCGIWVGLFAVELYEILTHFGY